MNLRARDDESFMKIALIEAEMAADHGEVPVGAVVVLDGQVIARAYNQVEVLKDATAHAEIIAITQASSYVGDWRLNNATLYVTKEPCAMCAGAMVNCKLGRLVFGAADPRSGAAGGALNITDFSGHLHKVEVVAGILQWECLSQLQQFFRLRRQENKEKKSNNIKK